MTNTEALNIAKNHIKSAIWAKCHDGALKVLSGPEKHVLGTPRRLRKVWVVRYGVCLETGIAYGGFQWYKNLEEAKENLGLTSESPSF